MNGIVDTQTPAPPSGVGVAVERSLIAAIIALAAGGAALVSPPLALFALAALAARALIASQTARFDITALAGPVVAALIAYAFLGPAGAMGVLFVWRMFADTLWSVREAQRLAAAAGRPAESRRDALAHAWLTPAYGLMLVAFTAPHMVAGLPLDLPHVPFWIPLIVGGLALGACFDWALRRAADWRLGELAQAPAAHLLAHHLVFLAAFGLMIDVSAGVVALIAWRLANAVRQPSFTAVP
ncbi:MAG: hypothetical protein AB7Q23_03185 [Hyphomonadaceae bacterium]